MRSNQRKSKDGKKFMQVLDMKIWNHLRFLAKKRGITVQEYIRAIVIPFYFDTATVKKDDTLRSRKAKEGWVKRRRNKALGEHDRDIIPVSPKEVLNTPETERERSILATD